MARVPMSAGRGVRARFDGNHKHKRKARVKRGKGEFLGFRKQSDIVKIIKRRQKGIQYCYERQLAANPELFGKVMIQWRVLLNGKASKAFLKSSMLGSKAVHGCMIRQMKRWRFVKP